MSHVFCLRERQKMAFSLRSRQKSIMFPCRFFSRVPDQILSSSAGARHNLRENEPTVALGQLRQDSLITQIAHNDPGTRELKTATAAETLQEPRKPQKLQNIPESSNSRFFRSESLRRVTERIQNPKSSVVVSTGKSGAFTVNCER